MRLVFLGSGAFGIPTFQALAKVHEVALIITQPDRPAGRRQAVTPTPIGQVAERLGLPVIKPPDVNAPEVIEQVRVVGPDVILVIAYGQKIGRAVREIAPTINLHGSLLPKYRGAAPINRAVIDGETRTGVTVIDVADRMDAGAMYGSAATAIDPMETAGELHNRLAELGPELTLDVLDQIRRGAAKPVEQDESQATRAPKLTRAMGTVHFEQPAKRVRAAVHGLTPWPGCTVLLGGRRLKLLRVQDIDRDTGDAPPGTVLEDGSIACLPGPGSGSGSGAVTLLSVQPPGGKSMTFQAYRRGHDVQAGQQLLPIVEHSEQGS